MNSAVAFLTLAVLLARGEKSAAVRRFLVSSALVLTLLVGFSRVYLGVHWPTDVAAGWIVGGLWAATCSLAAKALQSRHTIEDAGINPLPKSGKVPVWFGGHHERTLERIAKWGDGWMPNAYEPDQSALDVFAKLRRLTEEAGRNPAEVGIEVWVSMGTGGEADWRREAQFWKEAGASHLALTTTFNRRRHRRIAGHTLDDHLAAMHELRERMRLGGTISPGARRTIALESAAAAEQYAARITRALNPYAEV